MSRGDQTLAEERIWIQGPWTDLAIGCGLWSLPLIVLFHFANRFDALAVSFFFYGLSLLCNNPHYMATLVRAYGSRADFQKYRFFTLYITVLIVMTGAVIHCWPRALPILFTVYLIWSPWHYTGQNFGLAMMFVRRTRQVPGRLDRNLLFSAYLASYLIWLLTIQSAAQSNPMILGLGISPQVTGPIIGGLIGWFLVVGSWAHYRLARTIGWRQVLPSLGLLLTQFVWFIAATLLGMLGEKYLAPSYYNTGVLAFMHCAQYLWITSYYERRDRERAGVKTNHGWRVGKYYAVLALGGIALFVPGPWVVSRLFGHDLVESYLIFASLVNIHHFILDGAIWKLRDGRIARLLLGDRNRGESEPKLESEGRDLWAWLRGASVGARGFRWVAGVGLALFALLDQSQYFLTLHFAEVWRLELAQRLNPADSRVYVQQARNSFQRGDLPATIRELQKAVAINPYNGTAQLLLGDTLTKSGRLEEAYAHYQKVPTQLDAPAHLNYARLEALHGQLTPALKRLQSALQRSPEDGELIRGLANLFWQAGRFPEAAQQLERYILHQAKGKQAADHGVTALETAFKLAECYQALGRRGEAANWFQKVGQGAESDREWTIACLAWNRRALLAETDSALPFQLAAARAALRTEDAQIGAEALLGLALLLEKDSADQELAFAAALMAEHWLAAESGRSAEQERVEQAVRRLEKALAGRAAVIRPNAKAYLIDALRKPQTGESASGGL